MSTHDIIAKALIYYDSKQPFIRYLKRRAAYTVNKTSSDMKRSWISFQDRKTGETVVETEMEILGIYYSKHKVWSWAWSHPGLYNSENYLAKEILRYSLDLGPELAYIKSVLTTSRGIVKDSVQLDINLAIGTSVIKQPYIYPYVWPVGDHVLVYYLVLLNQKSLDKFFEEFKQSADASDPDM